MPRRLLVALLLVPPTLAVAADDDPQREARLQAVQQRFLASTLADLSAGPASPRTLAPQLEPLLRYTNPVGGIVSDGTLFVWRDGPRPVAVCSFTVRQSETPPVVFIELTSLTDQPLACVREGRPNWTPRQSGLWRQQLTDADPPPDRPTARLVALRNLARRFTVHETNRDNVESELRLLPQPLDRFQDAAIGVTDAALFAFAEANDPQILLLIEAVNEQGADPAWRYSLARMSSRKSRTLLDGREVFAVENYWQGPRTPVDPYLEGRDGPLILESPGTNPAAAASGDK